MKRIYVAGASAEIGLIIEVMRSLREAGFTITYDWTEAVSKFGSAGDNLSDDARRKFARLDLDGVAGADVFWMLAPQNRSVGAWVELGMALALHGCHENDFVPPTLAPLIVISGATDSIFALLADKRFHTHEDALAWLVGGMK